MPLAMSIGPGVAMPARTRSRAIDAGFVEQLRTTAGHPAAGVFGALVLLGGNRVVGERLAGVVDHADLDVRAADIEADKKRPFGGSDTNGGFAGGIVCCSLIA